MPLSYRPGPSVRVTSDKHGYLVISSPLPIHRARISYSGALSRWLFVCDTAGVRVTTHRDRGEAIRHAGLIIGTLYRTDMRSRFTGPQRLAMGRTQCPAHVACRDSAECNLPPRHVHICKSAPEPVSIWCADHAGLMERGPGGYGGPG